MKYNRRKNIRLSYTGEAVTKHSTMARDIFENYVVTQQGHGENAQFCVDIPKPWCDTAAGRYSAKAPWEWI